MLHIIMRLYITAKHKQSWKLDVTVFEREPNGAIKFRRPFFDYSSYYPHL